jgi:hypothetical protein
MFQFHHQVDDIDPSKLTVVYYFILVLDSKDSFMDMHVCKCIYINMLLRTWLTCIQLIMDIPYMLLVAVLECATN